MLTVFLNNAQKEKYTILEFYLEHNDGVIDVVTHRIKAINDDLITLDIPLTLYNNLTYTLDNTQQDFEPRLINYYKKEILYQYGAFLLDQSTLFHLTKYIVLNGSVDIDVITQELNISPSYIYKLITSFNNTISEQMGITLQLKNKKIDFDGDLISILVFIFAVSKFLPETDIYPVEDLLNKPHPADDLFFNSVKPYLVTIFNNETDDKELLIKLFATITTHRPDIDELKLIGYKLIRQGGDLIDLCYTLLEYFRPNYPQINIDDTSLYIAELVKLIILIKTSPKELLFAGHDEALAIKYGETIQKDLENLKEKLPNVDSNIYTETDLTEFLLFVYPFLEQTMSYKKLKIFIELVDSVFISQLYTDTIKSTFNPESIEFVSDYREADLILTDNYRYIVSKSNHTFAYNVADYIKEFEQKKYLKFILDILESRTHMSQEKIISNISKMHYADTLFPQKN